ncbi:hypothetical protein JNM87_03610 [Candidatus Saccharibacteria bacterium]|nr:hypothetical protein [Candidatus Saccharibacteria bacterium]
MTIIKATCPCCGDIELTRDQVHLTVHPIKTKSFYKFVCPQCGDEVCKPAGAEVIRLLKMGGVVAVPIDVPSEATEPHPVGTITMDEVLDFTNQLARLDTLVQTIPFP